MKRVVLGFVGAMLLFVAGRFVVHALASPETKVRWRIQSMVDGFNRQRASPVLRGFASDYRDESSGADRELVHQGVVSLFFREKDPETKAFRLRAEIPDEELDVVVEEGGERATARGVLTVYRREGSDGGEAVLWRVSFEGVLDRDDPQRDDRVWRFERSTHETLDGERPR